VTFADSVLHLVRAGARIDSPRAGRVEPADAAEPIAGFVAAAPDTREAPPLADPDPDLDRDLDLALGSPPAPATEYEPGLADLEAAVSLVSAGLARRVVLSGFPSWPGLLWRAYELAESADLLILPTVVRPGGRVDIVITREIAVNG
jgi:hypothetical protein